MKRLALAVGAFFALTFAALAQPVAPNSLTGQECWSAGQGPGGPSNFLCINVVRNNNSELTTTITGSATLGVTAGFTSLISGGNVLITAQPSVATLTTPPNPFPDGGIVGLCNVTGGAFATNTVTLVANSGQTMNTAVAITTQAAGTCAKVQFNASNTTWYRIQ